jgi:hypothetical protein
VTTFEPEFADTVRTIVSGTTSRSLISQKIADVFKHEKDEVIVIVDDIFVGLYDSDAAKRVIKVADGGVNAHILLHEIGHLLGLPHPVSCCNICSDLPNHFMFDHVSPNAVYNQIMIQDLLMIANACEENYLCNDCETIGMHRRDRDFQPSPMFVSMDSPQEDIESITSFVNCIDCSVKQVEIEKVRFPDLKNLCKSLRKQKRILREKFEKEFEYYQVDAPGNEKQRNDYISSQVNRRKLFSLERFDILVEAKQNSLPPPAPGPKNGKETQRNYQKMRSYVQGEIKRERRGVRSPNKGGGSNRNPNGQLPDKKPQGNN